MKALRALLVLTAVLFLVPALAEDGAIPFDLEALENDASLAVFEDANGVDIVYRDVSQPWIGQCDDGAEALVFLDYVELANEDAIALRLSVTLVLEDMLTADTLTLSVGGQQWRFAVRAAGSEYDQVFMEDYCVCLAGESLSILQALGQKSSQTLRFELSGNGTVSGSVEIPGQRIREIYAHWVSLGGTSQDLTKVEKRWPLQK